MLKKLVDLVIGEALPSSDWLTISQADINLFADATHDHQWIHVDAQRCAKESPFACTIAHGYLTVTLMPQVFYRMFASDPEHPTMFNYGVEKLRFIEPVRVNDQIRYHTRLLQVEVKPSGRLFQFSTEVEIAGRSKPAMKGVFLMLLAGA